MALISKLSKVDIPENVRRVLEPLKDDLVAVENFGVKYAVELIKELFSSEGLSHGVHIFSMNKYVFESI